MREMKVLLLVVLGYLLGSIPFAYIAGRLKRRVDIRTVGSRNAGAYNVMLEVGRLPGIIVMVLDLAKGATPVLLARWLELPPWAQVGGGMAAVVGHCFPFYLGLLGLGFRGGMGLAASLGALLALMPLETLATLCILGLFFVTFKRVASSTLMGLGTLALIAWGRGYPPALILAPLLLLLLQGLFVLPTSTRMWRQAEDKKDLILRKWLIDPKAHIQTECSAYRIPIKEEAK
ncbi:MAG: glycerol-3-phosphate acyltransferase [Chloroflexi bacterium]|nr:glycerol-3-phosphate acyltransferase [Chloroflexota bacterium]